MSSITPTIGHKVWLWMPTTMLAPADRILDARQAFDASIAFVHPDGRINVTFADHRGSVSDCERVELRDPQDTDHHPTEDCLPYATWMPYQVGKAAP